MSGPDSPGSGVRRTLVVAAVVAACVVVAVLAASWDPPDVEDLRVYRDAAQRILDGQALYPPGSGYEAGQPLPFTYPPFAALALVPLALMPVGSAVAVWWLLSFLCLWWLVHRSFAALLAPLGDLGRVAGSLLVAGLVVVVVDPVGRLFAFGQIGLVLGVLCLRDLDLGVRRSRAAGTLVGVSAAVKLSPGGFVLTYLAARRWRAAATAVATVLVCWAVAALVLPSDTRTWLGLALDAERVGPVDEPVNVSWHGLVLRTLGAGAPATALWLLLAAVTLAIAAVRSGRALVAGDALAAATVMGFAIVLAAPISWTHHMVWVVPLLGILVGAGRTWWRWLLVLAVVAVLSPPAMAWLNDDLGVHRDPSVLDRLRFDLPILLMVAAVLLVPDRGRSAATPVAETA
ncbi:MAG: glycosyltransferase 87 family protein [Candidatus Nanopelagicales bacterium]